MAKLILSMIALTACLGIALGQSCGKPTFSQRANRISADGQRIVGGVEAKPNSHPWIVSIQQKSSWSNSGSHFCGGSLLRVHPTKEMTDIVLTAAHCVPDGVANVIVSAGAHNLARPSSTQQTVKAFTSVHHAQYDPDTTMNDIAVIKLEKPINFNSYVQPVCLPSSSTDKVDSTSTVCTVAGWGLTEENGDVSDVLNQVGVPTIDTKTCNAMYNKAGIKIDANAMICGGYKQGGKDSCQGDSGGPFVYKSGSSYVQYGVVSFGVGCARPELPGVYARVSNYLSWINTQIKNLSTVAKS